MLEVINPETFQILPIGGGLVSAVNPEGIYLHLAEINLCVVGRLGRVAVS